MLSTTNHIGIFIFIMMVYIVCEIYTDYHKQLSTGKRKENIKITSKAKWDGIHTGIVAFCMFEAIYWFILYFFILN